MARQGRRTFAYGDAVGILGRAATAGKKEGEGPLKDEFDVIWPDDLLGQKSWEFGECEMLRRTVELCTKKAGIPLSGVDALFAGDLNNQIIASGFAGRQLGTPFFGLYGACSTFCEGLVIASGLVSGGFLGRAVCAASSHFCTAERQFRTPLELGTQRPPQAQWTATAAGAVALVNDRNTPLHVTYGTISRVVDRRITDANHMGAAMAPAAADTIKAHFEDTAIDFEGLDLVATGDLGYIGREILIELLEDSGIRVPQGKLIDCGASLFAQEQDTHAGGSGCGCIASVSSGWIMNRMEAGELHNVLLVGTGAMLSPVSSQQGESIPGVAYAVRIESRGGAKRG